MSDDKQLLAAWRAGDQQAGATLFDRHYAAISRFFANKLTAGVDDLVQETFLACVENKETFREESSFRTYLFAIARNQLYMAYRRKSRDGERFDVQSQSAADIAPGMGTLISRSEEEQTLLLALRRIPIEHQVLLELYYWENLRAIDLAAIFDAPEGTIRTRLRRARQLLENELQSLAEDPALFERTTSRLEDWVMAIREANHNPG